LTIILERMFERVGSGFQVGLKIDEIKKHYGPNGIPCVGKRGVVEKVEVRSIYETAYIKCDPCKRTVTMGR
jgi:hypothetical protein